MGFNPRKHMTAPDRIAQTLIKKTLANRGRPHKTRPLHDLPVLWIELGETALDEGARVLEWHRAQSASVFPSLPCLAVLRIRAMTCCIVSRSASAGAAASAASGRFSLSCIMLMRS